MLFSSSRSTWSFCFTNGLGRGCSEPFRIYDSNVFSGLGIILKSMQQSWAAQGNLEGPVASGRPVLRVFSLCTAACTAWLWGVVVRKSCSDFSSGPLWFFLVLKNLCLRFECALPCALLATHGIVSREDVHCPFRIGMGRD